MEDATPGFLAERLAKAQAVPAGERSADVRAFIETCALQAELMEELGLPEAITYLSEWSDFWGRWTAAPALKLVRSHLVNPDGLTLLHSNELQLFAMYSVFMRTSYRHTGTLPADLGGELAELLERDPSLETLAVLAAGIQGVPIDRGWERGAFHHARCPRAEILRQDAALCRLSAGLLQLCNRAAVLMRQPAVRRRLQAELAALPHQLVSYEELLALYIAFGVKQAVALLIQNATGAFQDVRTAARLAVELLPQLAPNHPRALSAAANMAFRVESHGLFDPAAAGRWHHRSLLIAALAVARQQGSDYYIASCGYSLASGHRGLESAAEQEEPPPSAVLSWLLEAEAAHRRCNVLLPKQWTRQLDDEKAAAAPVKPWLQKLVRQGDRWRAPTPAEAAERNAAHQDATESYKDPHARKAQLTCSGCGKWAPQLRLCRACREVQYCSTKCQKAHWREHKARCKEVQAAKAAAAGAASTSGGGS